MEPDRLEFSRQFARVVNGKDFVRDYQILGSFYHGVRFYSLHEHTVLTNSLGLKPRVRQVPSGLRTITQPSNNRRDKNSDIIAGTLS